MDFSFISLLEEETSEKAGWFSGSNRLSIILTAAIVIVTIIAVYLLITNQKLTKRLKEAEEKEE